MGIADSKNCSFCGKTDFVEHFFFSCSKIAHIWKYVQDKVNNKFDTAMKITSRVALLGLPKQDDFALSAISYANHLILIAKMCIYRHI